MNLAAGQMRERFSGGMSDTFRSMHIRNFRLFFSGQIISQVGNWITRVGLTLLVLRITDDGFAVGVVVACEFLPMLLFGAWAGVVVDRADKRRLLIIVQIFAMLQSFVLAALAFMPDPPLLALYAVALAGGLTTVFDFPCRRAFVLQMVPLRDVPNAVSLNTALVNLARVFGPAIAGLLVTTIGYGWAFTIDAFTYVAVLVGLWMIRPAELRAAPRAAKGAGQVRAGFAYARARSTLWIPLIIMAIVGTLTYNFGVVLPLLAERTFHGSEGTFTLLYSALSIGSLVGALAAARRTTVSLRTVCITCAAFGATMFVFALAPTLVWAFPAVIIVGWASTYFMTAGSAIVQLDTEPEMQGRIGALQSITLVGSTPVGSPIVGWVCERFGARAGLVLGAVAALGAAGWGMSLSRRYSTPSVPPAPPAPPPTLAAPA